MNERTSDDATRWRDREPTCEEVRTLLDDYADDRLTPVLRRAVRRHLDGCPACQERLDELERLLAAAAALPRSLAPEHDLWPAIAARLGEQPPASTSQAEGATIHPADRRPVSFWRRPAPYVARQAAAAVLLLACGALLARLWGSETAPLPRDPQSQDVATVSATPVSATPVSAAPAAVPASFAFTEAEILRAKESLWLAVYHRRGDLSPAALEVVERNLKIIDDAIRELRQALAEDPGNPRLESLLLANHRHSIELLQRLAHEPAVS